MFCACRHLVCKFLGGPTSNSTCCCTSLQNPNKDFGVASKFISSHDPGRHVGLNFADAEIEVNQRHIGTHCKVVGNGGGSKKVNFGDGGSAKASASASPAVGGGIGAPAESRQVGGAAAAAAAVLFLIHGLRCFWQNRKDNL